MRKLYKFASMAAIAIFAAASFASCDDDEPEGPKQPTLEIGSISITAGYEAQVTITPSENSTSISWTWAAETAEPGTYTKVETGEGKAVSVTTPVLAPGKYNLFAYAENAIGKSAVAKKGFEVLLDVPVVKLGELKSERAGLVLPVSVIGAEEFYYALELKAADAKEDPAIPAEENFIRCTPDQLKDGNLVIAPERLVSKNTYFVFAYAENEKGKGTVSAASGEYDESKLAKLVDFEVINKTAYSLDVKVTMLEGCVKYVVGGFRNGAYTKSGFISSAKSSVDPDPFYPLQSYNWSDKSTTFPERLLLKNTLATSDESEGLDVFYQSNEEVQKYQVAVYAIDKDGNGTAYVTDLFEVPAPSFNATPTVKITAECTPQTISPTFTVEGDCAKLYWGRTAPSWFDDVDWTNEEATVAFLAGIRGRGICEYTGSALTIADTSISNPNTEFIVYAIPITADGKVGKLCYEKFTTTLPAFDGTGRVDMTFQTATANSLTYKVALSGAQSVRILHVPSYFFPNYKDNLEMLMYDKANSKVWTEYTAAELTAADNTITFENLLAETTYVLRTVTLDANGRISPVQEFPDQATLADGGSGEAEIDFSKGTGEITFNIISETSKQDGDGNWMVDMSFSVTKGANTAEAYIIPLSDIMDNAADVEASCKSFMDPTDLPAPLVFGQTYERTDLFDYDKTWGGSGIAIVTRDNAGNFRVAHYYIAKATKQ